MRLAFSTARLQILPPRVGIAPAADGVLRRHLDTTMSPAAFRDRRRAAIGRTIANAGVAAFDPSREKGLRERPESVGVESRRISDGRDCFVEERPSEGRGALSSLQ
jgi:hypothetical protein